MKSFASLGEKPKRKNTRFAMNVNESAASAAEAKTKSTGHFTSGAAPRVGGKAKATQGGVPSGGTKRMLVRSKKNVKHSAASPSAKKAARKLY